MYKRKNKSCLEKSKHLSALIKRRIMIILTAFMMGMSNVIYEEDKMIDVNQNPIEQEQEKDKER